MAIYGFRKLARKYLPGPLKPRKSVVDAITELSVSNTRSTKEYKTESGAVYRVEIDSSSHLVVLVGSRSAILGNESTNTANKVTATSGLPVA